eukprot:1580396-Amphidinium_carterae.1
MWEADIPPTSAPDHSLSLDRATPSSPLSVHSEITSRDSRGRRSKGSPQSKGHALQAPYHPRIYAQRLVVLHSSKS